MANKTPPANLGPESKEWVEWLNNNVNKTGKTLGRALGDLQHISTVVDSTVRDITDTTNRLQQIASLPQGVEATSAAMFQADGSPAASVTINWDEVLTDTSGEEIGSAQYEVWGAPVAQQGTPDVEAINYLTNPIMEGTGFNGFAGTGLVRTDEWSFDEEGYSLRVPAGETATSSITAGAEGFTFSVIARNAGQTVTGVDPDPEATEPLVIEATDNEQEIIVHFLDGPVTLSEGDWDHFMLVVGEYEGEFFYGGSEQTEDGNTFEWAGPENNSLSIKYAPAEPVENRLASLASSITTTTTIPNLPVNTLYTFVVRARTADGVWGSFSEPVTITTSGVPDELGPVSKPSLSSDLGSIFATWDGKMATGANPPRHLLFVRMMVSNSEDGTYEPAGPTISAAGQIGAAGFDVGTVKWVRFVAVDTLGRQSEPSDAVSIVVQGIDIDLSEIDQELADMRDDLDAVDGKVTDALSDIDDLMLGQAALYDTSDNLIPDPGFAKSPATTYNTGWIKQGTGGTFVKGLPGSPTYRAWLVGLDSSATNFVKESGTIYTGTSALNEGTVVELRPGAVAPLSGASVTATISDSLSFSSPDTVSVTYDTPPFAPLRFKLPRRTAVYVRLQVPETDGVNQYVVVGGMSLYDVTNAANAQDAADRAMTTASGKNTITDSVNDPSGDGATEGDWWRKWSTLGTSGNLLASWRWDGSSWVPEALDETYLPLVNIGEGTYGLLHGDRLVANSIVGDKIVAGSITSSKLTITDWTNLVDDPNFEVAMRPTESYTGPKLAPWVYSGTGSTGTWQYITTTGGPGRAVRYTTAAGSAAAFLANAAQPSAKKGDQFNIAVRVQNSTDDIMGVYISEFDESGSAIAGGLAMEIPPQTGWADYSTRYEITGDNTKSFRLIFYAVLAEDHTSFTNGQNVWIISPRVRRMNGGELIVDGTITGDKIQAEAIQAEHVAAGAIGAEQIQAHSISGEKIEANSITSNEIAAGAITATEIEAGSIGVNHVSPSFGDDLDLSANDTVTIIAGQLTDVRDTAEGAASDLEQMQTYYQFGPDGATISKPGSTFALALSNENIEMLENGNVVSYWNSGQMFVNSLVADEVILGNHKLEKYSTGTVVRVVT